jgi:transaldolase
LNSLSTLLNKNQTLWLENITREQLQNRSLAEHLQQGLLKVKGISINPKACAHALRTTGVYDNAIRNKLKEGLFGERLALELLLEDARDASDLLRPVFNHSNGIDGWVSLPVFPMTMTDTVSMITTISTLYSKAMRPNIIITIPGMPQWLEAFEAAIFLGIPVTTAFLLSPKQFFAAANAYLRGIERRIVSRLNPVVTSFASISFSRLVAALSAEHARETTSRIGIAMAGRIYKAARDLRISPEWRWIYTAGARPLCLIWQTDTLCDSALLRDFTERGFLEPFTVTAMTESREPIAADTHFSGSPTLKNFGDCEETLSQYLQDGNNLDNLTERLQHDEVVSLTGSVIELLDALSYKCALITEGR